MTRAASRSPGPAYKARFIIAEFERAWGPADQADTRAMLILRELARAGLLSGVVVENGVPVDAPATPASIMVESWGGGGGPEVTEAI